MVRPMPPRPKPAKLPKTIKLPWRNSTTLAASPDGSVVIAAGELGAIGRVNLEAWQLEPWPAADGFVNDVSVAPDGSRVAIGVTGDTRPPHVEIRDATSGAITSRIITKRNPRASWSPSGALLVAKIEADVDHEYEQLAILDAATRKMRAIKTPKLDSLTACFIDDDTVLAFVRRANVDDDDKAYRVLRVAASGTVTDVGPSSCRDSFRSLTRIAAKRFVLASYNEAWCVVDDKGKLVAEGERCNAIAAGDAGIASAHGPRVRRFKLDGKAAGKAHKAKKRVDAMCFGGGKLLLLESEQIEIA
jgi:hypothetical protein